MKHYFSFVFVACVFHWQLNLVVTAQDRVRYVDSKNGLNNTGNCTEEMPCSTLQYAVYGNDTSDRDLFNCNASLANVSKSIIMVEDGIYNMSGYGLVLCEVSDITIQAVRPGMAIVQCHCFNCTVTGAMFGNIYLQRAKNITFVGMVFERCGYNASNVFVRNTEGLTFKNCTFR